MSIESVAEHFPLLVGNVMNGILECALLNASIPNAQIVAQDMGYFHTLLNFYKKSGSTLGSPVTEIDVSSLAPVEHSFSLNIAVDSVNGIGCSYLKESDEIRIRQGISRLHDTPSPSSPVPTQNASVSPSEGGDSTKNSESACFPSTAWVKLSNGSFAMMSEVQEGDMVLDGDGTYSKVLMFTHADSEVESEFVLLKTSIGSIVTSPLHYVYVNSELKSARYVKVGDMLSQVKGENTESISVEQVIEKKTLYLPGLYNPQTVSGNIVVFWDGDGVMASTYTESIPPVLAHILLAPLRWAERNFGTTFPALTRVFAKGDRRFSAAVVRALVAEAGSPRGPL
ncbi:Desert hedgehog protein B [Gracilariopsis chorda]|uniref:Desert hedgehog protein B n=1 Tax=Gracilariopsis chorda TaxID=448386 RepID=A0A2V3IMK3_9FLOR|nr:Desert hedgehog protein B [Gracilariopsis chorda]|eukprot:PXF43277.1 Desert hedgehog protein B [Gracilariopsis chorda]